MLGLQHVGANTSSPLTYYLSFSHSLCSPISNAVSKLACIPFIVGGAFILAGIQRKGLPRDMYDEVTPYIQKSPFLITLGSLISKIGILY